MQVKQRLQLNAALSVIASAAILLVLILAVYHVIRAVEASDIADEIVTSAFERVTLRNDYVQGSSERSKAQWFAKHEQIARRLMSATEKFRDPADQKIIAEMTADQESIGRIFSAIVKNRERAKGPAQTAGLLLETEERLLTQLNMRIYGLVLQARGLQESSREALFSTLRLAAWGTACVLFLVFALVVINSWTMGQSITARVRRLRDGALTIGGGNLEHRIDVTGDDELADLSETFNAMTAKLHGSYRDLENENEERRRAEAELKESRKFLEIANRSIDLDTLLQEFVGEMKAFTGCEAVGIRIMDEAGNIPYLAYDGFSRQFYERESPLSLRTDQCMCINVVKGTTDPGLPFYTEGGSFYMNGTTRFLATVSEADKGGTRNVCNQTGYESVALIPIRAGEDILGLIHLADCREGMVPKETVRTLEQVAVALGTGIRRARAEEELRRQRERFKVTLASIGDAVIATDIAGRITFINPVAQALTGWRYEEVLGQPVQGVFRIVNDETRAPGEDIVARVLAEGSVVALANHTALVTRDGREIPIEDSAAPIRNRAGGIDGTVLVFHDVTAKRLAQAALRESENRYRNLFETMTEGFSLVEIISDDTGKPCDLRYLAANPAFERQTGLKAADVVGRTMRELFPGADATWFKRYGRVALTGEPAHFEEWFGPLGRCFEVSAYQTVPGRFAIMFLDITERKRAEQAVADHTARLEAINKELEGFSFSISHDLRAPLRAIKGFSQIILKKQGGRFDEETRRRFRIITDNTETMVRLIDDMLDFSHLTKQDVAKGSLDMEGLIREVWQESLKANPGREMTLKIEPMPAAWADRAMIREVYGKLLGNAIKFTQKKEAAVIEAGCYVQNIETVYYVWDNGVGFDMRYYDKLFSVYQRLHIDDFEGRGIGLALVQRIIHKHGGHVWAEGKVGEGACFYFTLPEKAY